MHAIQGAHARLIEENITVVGQVVGRLMATLPSSVDRDDLVSAGHVALVQAARSFDDTRGVPFEAFARTRVRGAVLDELRSMDWASRSVRRRSREIDAARQQLAVSLDRQPTDDEIAACVDLSVEEVRANRHDVARADVGTLPEGQDGSIAVSLISAEDDPADQLVAKERLEALHRAVAALPPKHRRIVEGSYLGQVPLADLAAELGVTDSRISQLRAEAVRMLAAAMQELVGGVHRIDTDRIQRKTAVYVEALRAGENDRARRLAPVVPIRLVS